MNTTNGSPRAPRRLMSALAIATVIALGSLASQAQAQPRPDEHHDGYRGPPPRAYHRDDRRDYDHGWSDGYYRAPPVVYGAPRYYQAPPPVIYNPGIGIYLPGVTLGIH